MSYARRPDLGSRSAPGWWQKAVTTISNWLVVGPDPKVRDPQNSAVAASGSSAGVAVTDHAALSLSTFFACLRLVAGTIGSLPGEAKRRGANGAPIAAPDSPVWKVLHDEPNADQTPVDFVEFLVVSLLMRGNFYARKVMDGSRLVSLEPVRPDIVDVRRGPDGALRYRWGSADGPVDLGEDEVFHVRGFGGGPLGGLSVINYARQSLGLAIAADRAAGSVFANGVHPSGVLSFEKFLTAEQREIAHSDLVDQFVGAQNVGRPFILEGGASWEQITMKADEAQLLESRAWSVEEICRWFGVPPFMIGHNEKTTSWGTGIEQMTLAFVIFTLTPYLRRIELAVRKQLMTPAERASGLYFKFNLEGLLRGDSAGRARFYEIMTRIGVMSRNECRAKEDLAPIDGGDVILVQSQYVSLEEAIRQELAKTGA